MSHGVITLIIAGCDQYPANCWIAVLFFGDSFQQFNDITNVPTFSFDPWLLRMKSLHLFSSPRTTLLFCGIYFCFTIILSPLSDSQFSIFDILLIHFTGLLFTIKFFIESSFVNHRRITCIIQFFIESLQSISLSCLTNKEPFWMWLGTAEPTFIIQFLFKTSQYFLCLKKYIGFFSNVVVQNVPSFWEFL